MSPALSARYPTENSMLRDLGRIGTCCLAVVLTSAVASAKPDRVVLGYSAAWRDADSPPAEYDWDALTYVARAFLMPSPDGSLSVPPGYFDATLESAARGHGVKLLISVGGGSGSEAAWVSVATHPPALAAFTDGLARLMAEHHYDGVDIDWEPSPSTDAEGAAYATVLRAVRARCPRAVLTTAIDTNEYAVKFVHWPGVIAAVDYINVMTYDYAGSWGGVAGHESNLYPPADYPPIAEHSADEGMRNLVGTHGLPPAKLLMGMTFWAYRFRADRVGGKFPANAAGYSDDLAYQQVLDLIGTGHYDARWDAAAAVPYLQRRGGGTVVTYENPTSIRRKCDYAKAMGCAGLMIWDLGGDQAGRQAPLMDAVAGACGVKPMPIPQVAAERRLAQLRAAAPPLDAGRATDVTGMPDSQIEATRAALEARWGVVDDQRWQSAAPPRP